MTTEYSTLALIYRWFDEVWDKGQEETIDELYAADGKAWGIGDTFLEGPDAFKGMHRLFHESLSDIQCNVEDVIAAGDRAAMRGTLTMTHRASGKTIILQGGCFIRVRDGQISEAWNTWDFLGVLTQLGVLEEDAFPKALRG